MILCLDTITEFAGVALVDVKKCHAYFSMKKEGMAETIIKIIDQALRKARAKSVDLTGVIVIKGPGSFTSLRVGLAVANQFAHQLKIPIIGLRTDEWWMQRLPAVAGTDERPVMYVQSMNREEVYTRVIPSNVEGSTTIISIAQLALDLSTSLRFARDDIEYLGQLSDDHRALPSHWHKVASLKSSQDTWVVVAQALASQLKSHKTYALVEPFYGKEPTITKSKKV